MKRCLSSIVLVVLVFALGFNCLAAEWLDVERKEGDFGTVRVDGTSAKALWALNKKKNKSINLSAYGVDGSLSYFHGMFYEAKVTKTTKAKCVAPKSKKKLKVKKGSSVIVIRYKGNRKKALCKLKKSKKTVYISAKYLKFRKFIYNSSKPYADVQVEDWVNSRKLTSKSNFLIMVSKYNQRAWIMVKRDDRWACKYILEITTSSIKDEAGKGNYPSDYHGYNECMIGSHYVDLNKKDVGISLCTPNDYQIHQKAHFLYPNTKGSLGMCSTDYNFILNYIPVGTKVVVF